MDKKRNIELENWLIETTGGEMMVNHLGPNWNRFHEECGFYPNISMTIADQVWEHQQKRIDELQARVDAVEQVISKVRNGNYSSDQGECVAKFIACMLEQALKGGEV